MPFEKRFVLVGLVVGSASLCSGSTPVLAGLCSNCGGNSATVGDGIVFDELSIGPPPKEEEDEDSKAERPKVASIKSVVPGGPATGTAVTLDIRGDTVLAFTADVAHQSVPLPGIIITLRMRDGREYEVTLERLLPHMLFWATPQNEVPAYVFKVMKTSRRTHARPVPPGKPFPADDGPEETAFDRYLCPGKLLEPVVNPLADQEHAALIFAGDHYNSDHTVTKQEKGLFNLACFGTASAKMHLLRHTTAGIRPSGISTQLEERTAMLRAITADYCGDGRSWTGDGTPLWWTDKNQSFPLGNQPDFLTGKPVLFKDDIEAIWGTNGKLLCLNEPRRVPVKPDKACTTPAVVRKMVTNSAVACPNLKRIPHCRDFEWTNSGRSPFAEPALSKGNPAAAPGLADAYVVTVNRPRTANYCNDPKNPKSKSALPPFGRR
jgi:hypothetical protein